ncbi:MAG: transcription antitermination factor NusB [Lentisphaeria bacterium]|jgi:N utilization substance protein B
MSPETKDSPKTARSKSAVEAFQRRRFLARACAMQYAFQMDVQNEWEASDQQLADFRSHLRFELLGGDEDEQTEPAADKELTAAWEHALLLMRGLVEQRAEVDSMIRQAATNWTLERMSLVDRAILRTATYEMAFVKKVPVATAINDAIELAKKYGEVDSPSFVNGVLDRIRKNLGRAPTSSGRLRRAAGVKSGSAAVKPE